MNRDITKKVVIITGATDGIGLATATEVAKGMPRLVLIARNLQKGNSVVEYLIRESRNENIVFMQADLSSQADIRNVVKGFLSKYDRLDMLINNVGAYFPEKLVSVDGHEMTFALNHLNYFLLTNLLLDTLKKSVPSRIINVSSMAHATAKLDWDNLNMEKKYKAWQAYANSKLYNLYFTYELDKKLKGTGVTVNAVHPGLVNSKFGKEGKSISISIFNQLQRFIGKTPEEGASTSIYLALSDEVEGISGKYFADEKAINSSKLSYNESEARRLWEISEKMTEDKR